MADYDVIVAGAGNAALAAANSAREAGAERVLVLEKANRRERGGNTFFSGGLFRIAFDDPRDLAAMVPDAGERIPGFFEDALAYTKEDFWADLLRVTRGKTDRELATILIDNSFDAIRWAREFGGVPMEPATTLSGIRVGNRIKWQKGAIIRAEHEGIGLSTAWFKAAERNGIEIRYETAAADLLRDRKGAVAGVVARGPDGPEEISAGAVVLGCGGFEANAQWRAQYLSAPWDHAKVRGTAHNQGDGLRMALAIGALPWGQWSGRHATPISNEWPDFADRGRTDKSNRLSYPYGVMIDRTGERFCDEGEDFGLLHLRQVRRGNPAPAGRAGLAGFRRPDRPPAGAALRHQRAGAGRHAGGAGRKARTRRPAPRAAHIAGIQRGGPGAGGVRSPRARTAWPPAACRRTRPTGRCGSTRRPSRPIRRPAASPSPSAG